MTSSQYFIESFILAQRVASNKIVIRRVFFDVARPFLTVLDRRTDLASEYGFDPSY
jgi:hypothetical protein